MEDGSRHTHNLAMGLVSAQHGYKSIPYSINFSKEKVQTSLRLLANACLDDP